MNNSIIYQVDAFTTEAFKGNPAGVMILEKRLDEKTMQSIAMEMNLSETAFVYGNGELYEIRFFTPTVEIPLCGHATLASAHILYETGIKKESETIHFKAKGGDLSIHKTPSGIQMSFPSYTVSKIDTPNNFKNIMGFSPLEVYACDNNWKIAIAASESEILNGNPTSYKEMIANDIGHLMITSIGDISKVDYVVRCFAPEAGIDEDPVTGSAQCGLVPLWNLKTGNTEFSCKQVSERTGDLALKLVDGTVEITGNAVTIFKAELNTLL
ncbi:PhzF family phenazine biosynthesis protein [Wenyingzhuangia sp. IMCC45574]